MEYLNFIIPALLFLFLLQKILPTKGVRQMTTVELKQELIKKEVQFIDVRTTGEYKSNHIKKFKNIPLQDLSNKVSQLSKEKEIVVICQSGMRSNKATKLLKKLGFKKIANVKGGMSAWN
ncbi:rhodanese [Alkalihalophilus pseudofirmus]|uniref:rhodanese-like domain-containing protein n=1 Tax=Alkalihalobacterium alkalinitrilicum TaxID=427920 RepID=UPI00094C7BBA|nr:rhodanese-like domain-containing protein [Alkalihalobacterium alkalinitrilicum]OLO26139.1 rhodanese [Alkalihalophilus pseudofirmus]